MIGGREGSDRLHAFVDGQLPEPERLRFMEQMGRERLLQHRVDEVRRVKEYIGLAYEEYAPPQSSHSRRPRWLAGCGAAAAVVLLLITGVLVWAGGSPARALPELAGLPTLALSPLAGPPRVLLHIDTDDPDKFTALLTKLDTLLRHYGKEGVQVEVIANAGGLDLLRTDRSPLSGQVAALLATYPNVRAVACGQAISRLREEGERPILVSRTEVAPSALVHVIERLREGWVYVQI